MKCARVLLVGGLLGALACGGLPVESFAPIDLELEAVRGLDAPPSVVVSEEVVTRRASGGACGHSPLCVLIVPVLIYDSMFPERHRELRVDGDGELSLTVQYSMNDELLQARYRDGEVWRHYRRLDLEELERALIVEVSSAPVSAPEQVVASPVLVQVDLIAAYQAALSATSKPERRTALLREAWSWLGEEGRPLIEAHLGDPDEEDATRAALLTLGCTEPGWLELARVGAGPETVYAALRCGYADPELVDAMVRHMCDERPELEARHAELPPLKARPPMEGCSRDRQAVLELVFGLEFTPGLLDEVLVKPSTEARWILNEGQIDRIRPGLPAAWGGDSAGQALTRSAKAGVRWNAVEGQELLRAALQAGEWESRALAVECLMDADPEVQDAVRQQVEGDRTAEVGVRVALGSVDDRGALATRLPEHPGARAHAWRVDDEGEFAEWVLTNVGCTGRQIERAGAGSPERCE